MTQPLPPKYPTVHNTEMVYIIIITTAVDTALVKLQNCNCNHTHKLPRICLDDLSRCRSDSELELVSFYTLSHECD